MVISCISMTCSACPFQLEGFTTCGKYIYVRERHGIFSISIDDQAIYRENIGDDPMTVDFVQEHFRDLEIFHENKLEDILIDSEEFYERYCFTEAG